MSTTFSSSMKIHNTIDLLSQCKDSALSRVLDKHNILAATCGIVTFPAVIGIFHHLLWKNLNMAAHSRFAGLCGFVTVCSSAVASVAAIETVHDISIGMSPMSAMSNKDFLTCTLFSLTNYALLARSFKVVLPSHILHPGAFAREGVTIADYSNPVTVAQRRKIQKIGFRHGCHTCGRKYSRLLIFIFRRSVIANLFQRKVKAAYFADHSPPVALASLKKKKNKPINGMLYPQCQACSNCQSSHVRSAKSNSSMHSKAKGLVTHSKRLRLWKLFLPWPLFISYAYVMKVCKESAEYSHTLFK